MGVAKRKGLMRIHREFDPAELFKFLSIKPGSMSLADVFAFMHRGFDWLHDAGLHLQEKGLVDDQFFWWNKRL